MTWPGVSRFRPERARHGAPVSDPSAETSRSLRRTDLGAALPVIADDRLRERARVVLQQPPVAVLPGEHGPGAVGERASWEPPNGETTAAVADRVSAAITRIAGLMEAGTLAVVVSHGGALRIGMERLLGFPAQGIGVLGPLGGIALVDLGVGQPLPVAAGPLAQVLVRRDRQAGQPGERRGGLLGAGQVGGEDRLRAEGNQAPGRVVGLGLSGLVERDVGLALEPVLGVPRRLAVPPQDDPLRGAQCSSPVPAALAANTAAGSAITGQSFQIRSRE
jgi:hypothetical protein